MNCYVFAYGTLRDAKVRKEVLGYSPVDFPARLRGFSMSRIVLYGMSYPIILESENQ